MTRPGLSEQTEDSQWLRDLNLALWDSKALHGVAREATQPEIDRIFRCVETYQLVAEMFCASMFGGCGLNLYDGQVKLLSISEFHLPYRRTLLEHLMDVPPVPDRVPGGCRDDAWNLFSKYSHSSQNQAWLKALKLNPSQDRYRYNY